MLRSIQTHSLDMLEVLAFVWGVTWDLIEYKKGYFQQCPDASTSNLLSIREPKHCANLKM
jgi:hypothetical protein